MLGIKSGDGREVHSHMLYATANYFCPLVILDVNFGRACLNLNHGSKGLITMTRFINFSLKC